MNCSSHIILIQSCKQSLITEKYSERYPYPPIGLLYISNIGEMNGYDVTILDLYLEPMGRREFLKRLEGLDKPVLVGISSYTDSILDAYKIAAAVKGFYGNIPIIMGGAHVSFMYESVMRECPVVDYCCIGEGEAVLVELLEYLRYGSPVLSSIKSLVYRGPDGEPVANEKRGFVDFLDIAPFPWFSEKMQNCIKNDGGIIFVSSRGCPGECVFCASRALSGSKYRYHSAEWIASLVYFYQRFIPFRMYGPLDDTFTVNRTRLKKFVTYMKQMNMCLPWSCKSRVDVIDNELVEILHSANCILVHIGVESGDDDVLRAIKKRITVDDILNAISLLSSKGIRAECSFILGHPTDSLESMERTLILASKLDNSDVSISVVGICTPFPGTKIWNRIKEYGLRINSYNWRTFDLGTPIFSTDKFTLNDLRRAFFFFNYSSKAGQGMPGLTEYDHSPYVKKIDHFMYEIKTMKANMKKDGA